MIDNDASAGSPDSLAERIDSLARRLADAESEIADLRGERDRLHGDVTDLRSRLENRSPAPPSSGPPDLDLDSTEPFTSYAETAEYELQLRALADWASGDTGLASPTDLADLTLEGAERKARRLRPSLRDAGHIRAADAGFLIGRLDPSNVELRASWEDVTVAFMGPRAGKTTALAVPNVIQAPGACVVTSNKADIYTTTVTVRAAAGRVWLFDPQQIVHGERRMWWNMLAMARTLEGANRLAMHLVTATESGRDGGFWARAGENLLRILLHTAWLGGRSLADVLAWLSDANDATPVAILREHGMVSLAANLEGTVRGAWETREGIYEHARQAVSCLLDPDVLAWVTPDPHRPEFRPEEFVGTTDTLYLLSKDGGGGAAGVIAAATDACLRAGVAVAEATPGGRLDPPMEAILDEACNICKIADLPDLYSHLGSRGILPLAVLQSYQQGVRVWGTAGMDTLWSAATVKLLGPGLDDHAFAERISHLVGTRHVAESTTSHGNGGRTVSYSRMRERILEPSDIREIARGTALLLATSTRPARVRLQPWYRGEDADRIQRWQRDSEAAIAERAARPRPHRPATTVRATGHPEPAAPSLAPFIFTMTRDEEFSAELRQLAVWVNGFLVPVYISTRPPAPQAPWCAQWHQHPEAVARLHALWLSYHTLTDTERAGANGPHDWHRDYLDPVLTRLRAPNGPFAGCMTDSNRPRHRAEPSIATVDPP